MLKTGWDKLPVNSTQVKERIVERLLSMREVDDDGHFFLNQRTVIATLQNIWSNCAVDLTPHPNDRLCLFGIVFG